MEWTEQDDRRENGNTNHQIDKIPKREDRLRSLKAMELNYEHGKTVYLKIEDGLEDSELIVHEMKKCKEVKYPRKMGTKQY